MVIDDGEEPSKSKSKSESESESETINMVEELSTPRIPRVPPLMRNHENNKGMFDPKVVSIGPYHHGKEDLQLVETVKPMLAALFLQDSDKNKDEVYSMILENVDDARSYYVKRSTDEYSCEQFATMMLLDGCFILAIIEDFFLCAAGQKSKYDDVRNHLGLLLWYSIPDDIFYLIENQLPLQVLELIMSLKFKEDEGMKSINVFLNSVISSDTRHILNKDKVIVSETDRESFHLLQLARTKYLNLNQSLHILESQVSTKKEKDKFQCKQRLKDYIQHLFCYFKEKSLKIHGFVKKHKYSQPKSDVMEYFLTFGSATELKAKGIHFRPNPALYLLRVLSSNLGASMDVLNFILSFIVDLVITSYIDFMQLLIDNQDDVKELRSKHILFNALGSDQEVANVFKEITTFGTYVILYDDIKQRIQVSWVSSICSLVVVANHLKELLSESKLVFFRHHFEIPDNVQLKLIGDGVFDLEMANASTIALPLLAITEGGVHFPLHPLLRTTLRHWGLIPSQPNVNYSYMPWISLIDKLVILSSLMDLHSLRFEDERHIRNAVKSHFANRRRSIYPRICTFGIGSYCNHYFLQMLAQIGRGNYDAAFDIDSVNFQIQSLFNTASSVILANITIDALECLDLLELYPNLIPDLSSGSSLIVSGKYNGNFPDSVIASGLLPDMSNFTVELEVQKSKGIPLDRVIFPLSFHLNLLQN
ncbi:hypothetical protein TEA_023989 [Camellia sinensis var. sinensis]|uniref:Uncharacterized protein n=1 Tax=Camellia sinensis var. sinensis TaxID=542762 RepID=A0A4V6RYC8_CAMSN|nr:hypothetical protein TEA_023989 [Camellia sinensis var. sinensis]